MGLILMLKISKIDYVVRMAAIEHSLMGRIKCFVHDLLVFGKEKSAQKRLKYNLGSPFYMSEVYFTTNLVDRIIAFKVLRFFLWNWIWT